MINQKILKMLKSSTPNTITNVYFDKVKLMYLNLL